MNVRHQIEMHARSLERWFSPRTARRKAIEYVESGACWKWPEPQQLELFA